ncbi:hypothetical protein F5Y06DRAFT_307407 [Hypoxylon sp. FL0890]|nr:hypothetical protein F5Y06DRAFT_307407 [Hypoxylon sp. FL0890]
MSGFADLPPEVRELIWEYCLPGPRNVTVLRRHTPAPVVLHICRESRVEAQRWYELAFPIALLRPKSQYAEPVVQFEDRRVIWFNFKEDRLCLDSSRFKPRHCKRSFQRLRSLGLRCCPGGKPWNLLRSVAGRLRKWETTQLPWLKEIVFFGPAVHHVSLRNWYASERAAEVSEYQWDACERLRRRMTSMPSMRHSSGIPMRWVPANSAHNYAFNDPTDSLATERARYYVFLCATTGQFEVQKLTKEQLGWTAREYGPIRGFRGCPEHPCDLSTSDDEIW